METNIWVKLIEIPSIEPFIKIPTELYPYHNVHRWFYFGIKKEKCSVETVDNQIYEASSYHSPIEIQISSEIIHRLLIPVDLVYQLKITPTRIQLGPTIGLLLGERNHLYHPDYMEKYNDRFGIYKKFGGIVVAFSLRSIDWKNNTVHGFIYDPNKKEWKYGKTTIPFIIYRRNFHQNPDLFDQLFMKVNGRIFNSVRYDKWELYQILQRNPKVQKHLPHTQLLTNFDRLFDFLNYQKKVILKPKHLSRGRGIIVLEVNQYEEKKYILHDYRDQKRPMSYSLTKEKIIEIFEADLLSEQSYIYQTFLDLAKVNSSPFDIRIVMQKSDLEWQCSGIECRIAGFREQITNISRGGNALNLKDTIALLPQFNFQNVEKSVINLCFDICNSLDQQGEYFAELGLDVGIDSQGTLWFIEANVYPSFKGFKTINYQEYLKIRYQPLLYAAAVQGFQIRDGET